jgi:hypothetical protein
MNSASQVVVLRLRGVLGADVCDQVDTHVAANGPNPSAEVP